MTPDSLYAALDEPNADIDLILGQIADWYADHCDERRDAACRYMVAHGKRPRIGYGWYLTGGNTSKMPLIHVPPSWDVGDVLPWYETNQTTPNYFRHAADALADQWPAEVADWWHALRTRGEVPVAGMDSERMVTT